MTSIVATGPSEADRTHLLSLIQVLLPHPGGLRRWSVMRAIRAQHEKAALETSHKLEDEVEKVFRRHGGDLSAGAGFDPDVQRDSGAPLFYRPKDRAGEVWAIDPEIARAWLTRINGISTNEPRESLSTY